MLPLAPPPSGVIPKIVDISDDTNSNIAKIIALTIVYDIILGNTDYPTVPLRTVAQDIKKALEGYQYVSVRIKNIPITDYSTGFSIFRDAFVSEFTLFTSKYLTYNQTTKQLETISGPHPPGETRSVVPRGVKKRTLADPDIKDFYKNVVVSNPGFYEKFFNLVRTTRTSLGEPSGEVPITEAQDITDDATLSKYRLNVRKEMGRRYLTGSQMGGLFGDIILITLMPDYPTDGSIKDLWVTRSIRIAQAKLTARGPDAIRYLIRTIYNTPITETTITVYDARIPLQEIAKIISLRGYFPINYQEYFKWILGQAIGKESILPPTWKESEYRLSEHILREASEWSREDNTFVRRKKDGTVVQEEPGDNCALFDESTRVCIDFFGQCLTSNENDFPEACSKLFEFKFKDLDFEVNTGMNKLKEEIMKINPIIAFAILKQFRFGSYLAEESSDPFFGFRRYKVQSVGSWLEELFSEAARCAGPVAPVQNPCDPRPLKEQLGRFADIIIKMAKDPTKKYYPFFNYLDVLVQWVNANPQVLNPEETKNPKIPSIWPDINKSYKTYNYLNPYRPAEVRLRGVSCGLERLKSSIINELAGSQASATISTIANVPLGIEMPLARPGFISPVPIASNIIPMLGGGIYDTEAELRNINAQYGYQLFDQIYKDLTETMLSMTGARKLKLTSNTEANINRKLENFKKTEEELRKSLVNLIRKNQLYQASHGYVNPYDLSGNNLASVLAKHSNLLALSSSYNKKAVNLIDLFQTMTKAILGKLEEGNIANSSGQQLSAYERPLTMGFQHDIPSLKKN